MSRVLVLMGSDSDWPVVRKACEVLSKFGIDYSARVLSAHRTPELLEEAVREAEANGLEICVCAAGVAAHLAGVVASLTTKPVVGIPIGAGPLQGHDSLLAMVQMPPGIPVATVAIDGAMNAGLLAVQILAVKDEGLAQAMKDDRAAMKDKVKAKDAKIQGDLP